jgi:SAM-dependent methyltransferase
MASVRRRRLVAIVAEPKLASAVGSELRGTSMELLNVGASALAPLRRSYRQASLAVVGHTPAMPLAVLVQRWTRVPWVAVADTDTLTRVRSSLLGLGARAFREAAAVLVEPSLEGEARRLFGGARVIRLGDTERFERIVLDRALVPDVRDPASPGTAALADAWTFLNDRATRLAIRAMPIVRKAKSPIHPRHLIGGSWHLWYLRHLSAGDRVLDVGCANGAHSLAAARAVESLLGVDVDVAALADARARAAAERIANVEFRLVDLTETHDVAELGRGSFDAVLLLDVLEHLDRRVEVLQQLRALLRPGGKLILSVPNRETPYRRKLRRLGGFAFSDPDHKMEYTDVTLEAELDAAGLDVALRERGGYDTAFAGLSTLIGVFSLRGYRRLAEHRAHLSRRFPERATALRVVALPRPDPS